MYASSLMFRKTALMSQDERGLPDCGFMMPPRRVKPLFVDAEAGADVLCGDCPGGVTIWNEDADPPADDWYMPSMEPLPWWCPSRSFGLFSTGDMRPLHAWAHAESCPLIRRSWWCRLLPSMRPCSSAARPYDGRRACPRWAASAPGVLVFVLAFDSASTAVDPCEDSPESVRSTRPT